MRFAVLGDLHLDPQDPRFERAREQLRRAEPGYAICLGDLGCGAEAGTPGAFEAARRWLEGLGVPFATLLGNHDLERTERFASDADAVACYCEVMGCAQPYRAFELGPALGITLSATRFRDKRGYAHEVSIDEAQFRWFVETLERERDRPVCVFSHAPPLGSRLRVLQRPHLRAGNAWLNQSNGPRRFHELLARHPQVRLWFSAHDHLGQDHPRALSHVGRCLFVHTGVIGEQTRDGKRQSRLVTLDEDTVGIETLDHASGARRRDADFALASNTVERFAGEATGVRAPFFAAAALGETPAEGRVENDRSTVVFSQQMWVEFDRELAEPVGVVHEGSPRARPRFVDGDLVFASRSRTLRLEANPDGYHFTTAAQPLRQPGRLRAALRALGARLRG